MAKKATDKLGPLIDILFTMRSKRRAVEEKLNEWKKSEEEAKQVVIAALLDAKLQAGRGRKGMATIKYKDLATVTDWSVFYQFIRKHDAFELLHKRVATTACAERWKNNEEIPGVAHERDTDLSLNETKLGGAK